MSRSLLALLLAAVLISPAGADDEAGFKPIFDGNTLNGWKAWEGDEAYWTVSDGAITAESTAERRLDHNSFLVWDHGEVDDFELRLKFRITGSDSANSGIQFRGALREDGHVIGYQADIDRAGNWIGCLYDEAQRGVLATRGQKVTFDEAGKQIEQVGDAGELLSKFNRDGWNDYRIKAVGNEITLSLNGHQTVHLIDNDPKGLDLHGLLALQLHSGPPMKVEFKDIRLKRLPLAGGRKKVVFVAGTPSHRPGDHEHNAGCLLLAEKLNRAAREDGLPVVATVYTNGWPKDPTAMDNADTVVSYCDGGARHYLNDRLADFDHLVESRGVGLVCIHYAVETVKGEPGNYFLKWIGGYFEPHWSVNPHWVARFDDLPDHPITRGVEPFEINDEWYYHMRFVDGMQGVTPILTDLPPRETLTRPDGPHSGNPYVREAVLQKMQPQHVAWAYERPDGKGRGFGFTGGHFHKNWQDDNFRKIILNAIVWSTGLDVPESGVKSATPTQEEMDANQDQPNAQANRRPASQKQASTTASQSNVKAAYSTDVVTPATPGKSAGIDVDITGAKELWLVVTDGGDGYSCDWADWAEPHLILPITEVRTKLVDGKPVEYEVKPLVAVPLTSLDWKAATASFGSVQKNRNCNGGPLRIDNQPVRDGIGTHANSYIHYVLPEGHSFTRFKARGGLDNGGTDQGGCGAAASVQFHVYTQRPGPQVLAAAASGGNVSPPASNEPEDAVDQLAVHPELDAVLFASEPMMTNPASIDIDHLGRVWVCEAINYRAFRNRDVIGEREEGDRILILEDTDGDARADKVTVFYQGHDIDSAHGLLVLPAIPRQGDEISESRFGPAPHALRVLVSALDSIFYLIDDDGDLKADRKELLFTGIGGAQHDHGIHAVHFGPDGKLYFNFGNEGKQIKDKHGQPIIDKAGNEVNNARKPYQEGMVFRCNPDGSEFETLGWNFRNNWEVCVDSFGTMWQSDNDDDGNRGVRINYVMEYGNYGYRDELTGAGWRDPRTNMEDEIPLRHWHLNDPGVIPNLLQTGAGAPTGICFYEGSLLPEIFHGAIIHCDAGPNICRAYAPRRDGAGYTATTINILDGARNKWFRPSDVCVAPDGSLFVADWYDPGVGGHRMQDAGRGRLFRVAPKGKAAQYNTAKPDLRTPQGAAAALQSPNMTTRYLGWTALWSMGDKAVPALRQMWTSENPVMQARALGVLTKLPLQKQQTLEFLKAGLAHPNPDIRCAAIRLARQSQDRFELRDFEAAINLQDESPAARRELLIGLRELLWEGVSNELKEAFVALASGYDGNDRWYLEAIGIAADGRWDELLPAYLESVGSDWAASKAAREIVWRSRSEQTPHLLRQLIASGDTPAGEVPRYFRSLDFVNGESKEAAVQALAFDDAVRELPQERVDFIRAEAFKRLKAFDLASQPERRQVVLAVLDANRDSEQYVSLVDKFSVAERYPDLLEIARKDPTSQQAVQAVKTLLGKGQQDALKAAAQSDDAEQAEATIAALGASGDGRAAKLLQTIAFDDGLPTERRRAAIKAMGAIRQGAVALREMAGQGNYDAVLEPTLAATLHTVQWNDIKEFAARKFPLPPGKDSEPLPPLQELAERRGDIRRGSVLFHSTATCAQCHQVGTLGRNVGPDLSGIGNKLSRLALWESILYPSAAISHNYENWLVVDEDGNQYIGLLVSESDRTIEIKDAKGIVHSIPADSIEIRKKQDISVMPADIQKTLTTGELVDVVEYLTTLKAVPNETEQAQAR